MVFVQKWPVVKCFFFLGNTSQENVFYDILEQKTPSIAIKTRSSKTRKIDIFPKRLTHAFAPNMAIFPSFLFRQYRPAKCLYDILEQKTPF